MKRILIIVGVMIAAVAIVAIGMLLKDRSGMNQAESNQNIQDGTSLPIADGSSAGGLAGDGATEGGNINGGGIEGGSGTLPVAGISLVSKTSVIDYAINQQGIFLLAPNGSIINASSTDSVGQVSFENMSGAWFSPDGKLLLVRSGNKDGYFWNLFDIAKKTWKSIQVDTSEMFWSKNSLQLAYIANRANNGGLSLYNVLTGTTRSILTFSAPDLTLAWKDATHILIMDKPNSLVEGSIWEVNLTSGALSEFASNIAGTQFVWGGDKSGGLLFKAGSRGGILSIVDSNGKATQGTNFLTLPSKCVFGETAATSTIKNISDYLFCGIPGDQVKMRDSELPDDYLKGKIGTSDTLYAINMMTGSLSPVIPASQTFNFDATNVKIYGENVYFVNKNDRKLYKVSLSGLPEPSEAEAG